MDGAAGGKRGAMPGAAAPTMLGAPDGSRVVQQQPAVANSGTNMGSMWSRVQEMTRLNNEKDAENQTLKNELEASRQEEQLKQQRIEEEAQRVARKAAELQQSEEQRKQLEREKRALEEEVAKHERRMAEEEEARKAKEAAEGPPPKAPEEVRKDVLRGFDSVLPRVIAEQAQRTGAASVDPDSLPVADTEAAEPLFEIDIDAMLEAEASDDVIAEQYLTNVCEATAKAVEPARLQAVAKWKKELTKRRMLQDQLQELKGSIRVMCRVRPPDPGEETAVTTTGDSEVVVTLPGKDGRRSFALDHVFGAGSKQANVFEEVEPVLDSVLAGVNVCIFAYGQTGSGKTFTMQGKLSDHSLVGINPRSLRRLFDIIEEKRQIATLSANGQAATGEGGQAANPEDFWTYEVSVSYLEIYNEILRDLLVEPKEGLDKGKRPSQSLDVSMTGKDRVPGLTVQKVSSATEVDACIQRGAARRAVSATKCNAESSRSHSIVMVNVTGKNSHTGETRQSKLHLVDLAGSERPKKSGVSGQGMKEAQNINSSLSALSSVMNALQHKSQHVPYRDSKLTTLLSDSLGGDSKTLMFVNINPSASAASESKCSLEFATRVARVELGKVSSNTTSGASLAELRQARKGEEQAKGRVAELERSAAGAKEEQSRLEAELGAERAALAAERAKSKEYAQQAALVKSSESEKSGQALAEERSKAQALEEQLRDALARLAKAEEQAKVAQAALAAAPPARPASQAAAATTPAANERSAPRPHLASAGAGSAVGAGSAAAPMLSFAADAAPSPAPAAFPASPIAGKLPLPSPMVLPPSSAASKQASTPTLVPPTPVVGGSAPSAHRPPGAGAVPPAAVSTVPLVPVTVSSLGGGSSSVLGAAGAVLSSAAKKVSSVVKGGGGASGGAVSAYNLMDAPVNLMDAPVVFTAAAPPPAKAPASGGIKRTELAPAKPKAPTPAPAPLLDPAIDPSLAAGGASWVDAAQTLNAGDDADALFAQNEAACASPRVSGPAVGSPAAGVGQKRPSPSDLDSLGVAIPAAPTSTPGKKKEGPKWTPSKLLRSHEGGEGVRSARKVKFSFDDCDLFPAGTSSSAANQPAFGDLKDDDDDDGDVLGSFPTFSTGPTAGGGMADKENTLSSASKLTPNGGAASEGLKKSLSSGVAAAATSGSGGRRQFSLGGLGGGAARRVAVDKSKRSVRDRQTMDGSGRSGAIAKGNRLSLAAQQADRLIESASGMRPRNTLW